jgi:hypothetical protein
LCLYDTKDHFEFDSGKDRQRSSSESGVEETYRIKEQPFRPSASVLFGCSSSVTEVLNLDEKVVVRVIVKSLKTVAIARCETRL